MLRLRKDIQLIDKTKPIKVIADKLIIEGKEFMWNKDNILVSGRNTGAEMLSNIYGDIANINLDFQYLKTRSVSKN